MYYNINSFQLRWFATIILLLSICSSNGWGTTTYTKVTSGAQLSTNDVVIIASESASAPDDGVTGWNDNKDANTSTTEANWRRFTVTLIGDTAFTLHYTSSGTSYYIFGKDPDFTFNTSSKSLFMKSYLPNLAFGKSKKVSQVTAWRYLHLQNQSTYYRFYLSNNNYTQYYVWKVTESPSCADPTAPNNSSISLTTN